MDVSHWRISEPWWKEPGWRFQSRKAAKRYTENGSSKHGRKTDDEEKGDGHRDRQRDRRRRRLVAGHRRVAREGEDDRQISRSRLQGEGDGRAHHGSAREEAGDRRGK